MKYSPFLGASLLLAGCNQAVLPDVVTTGSIFASRSAPAYDHSLREKRPVGEAFLRIAPGYGNVIQVTEQRYSNGVQQDITFRTNNAVQGENTARVAMVVKRGSKRGASNLRLAQPSEGLIVKEMRRALPGVAMRVTNKLDTNGYGPFGYALGKAGGGVNCIYAWQLLEGQGGRNFMNTIINPDSGKKQLSVRMRICLPNASDERMVDVVRTMRLEADPNRVRLRNNFSWNSSGEAGPIDEQSIYQPRGYSSKAIIPAPEPRVTRQPVQRTVRTAPKPTVQPKPAPLTVSKVPVPSMEDSAKPVVITTAPVAPKVVYKAPTNVSAVPLPD